MIPQNHTRLSRPLAPNRESFIKRIDQIQNEAWYTNHGPFHEELRKRLSERMHCKNLTLFANGTLALICGLKALELKGDVLTTPFTFPATIHALHWANLRPIFCDIDPKTLNLDPNNLEKRLTPKTTAILAVHTFGTPCDCETLENFAKKKGLKLVFDAAHAFDLSIGARSIGTYGDLSMFSFHATKLFHTAEGGCLVYRDPELGEKLHLLQNFGIPREDQVIGEGTNAKLSELHSALGLSVLENINEERLKRIKLTERYHKHFEGISGLDSLPRSDRNLVPALQYFVLMIDEKLFGRSRDEVHSSLKNYGILARKYFTPLCCDISYCQGLPGTSDLPVARSESKKTLCLPLFGDLPHSEVDRIAKLVLMPM
jgi:dTDP-4-amino-4,6-dideoxygalactose transaminase